MAMKLYTRKRLYLKREDFKKGELRPIDLTVGMGRMIWIKEKKV